MGKRAAVVLRLLAACKDTSKSKDIYREASGAPRTSPSTVRENHDRGRAPRHDRTSPDAVDATARAAPERETKRYFFRTRAYYREFVLKGENSPLGLQRFRPIKGSSPATGVVDNEAGSDKLPGSSSPSL